LQGTVVVVVSPLGFGLDEKAQEAIEKWRFEPGRKAGMPVPIVATVEVNFRLTGQSYNAKDEQFRTRFNLALTGLKEKDEARRRKSAKAMEELAKQDFAPALYAFGKLLETGDLVPRDPERAGSLIRKSADKKFGPALYEVGLAYTQGNQVPKDTEKGLHLIRDAANYGSAPAQYFLANRYERGIEESPDPDRARRYFTLCAASGVAECQVRLAKLLLGLSHRKDREYIQGIAWLQLAAAQSQPEAQKLIEQESAHLTAEQVLSAMRLRPQLVHKP
jgi:TPR repeat protein